MSIAKFADERIEQMIVITRQAVGCSLVTLPTDQEVNCILAELLLVVCKELGCDTEGP